MTDEDRYPTTLFRVRAATLERLRALDGDDVSLAPILEAWLRGEPHDDVPGAPEVTLALGARGLHVKDLLDRAGRIQPHPDHPDGVDLRSAFGLLSLTSGIDSEHYVLYLPPEDVRYVAELFALLRARPDHRDLLRRATALAASPSLPDAFDDDDDERVPFDDALWAALDRVAAFYTDAARAGDALVNIVR